MVLSSFSTGTAIFPAPGAVSAATASAAPALTARITFEPAPARPPARRHARGPAGVSGATHIAPLEPFLSPGQRERGRLAVRGGGGGAEGAGTPSFARSVGRGVQGLG
jgi:hypothetical protein